MPFKADRILLELHVHDVLDLVAPTSTTCAIARRAAPDAPWGPTRFMEAVTHSSTKLRMRERSRGRGTHQAGLHCQSK